MSRVEPRVFNSRLLRASRTIALATPRTNSELNVWDASRPRFGSTEPCIPLARLIEPRASVWVRSDAKLCGSWERLRSHPEEDSGVHDAKFGN